MRDPDIHQPYPRCPNKNCVIFDRPQFERPDGACYRCGRLYDDSGFKAQKQKLAPTPVRAPFQSQPKTPREKMGDVVKKYSDKAGISLESLAEYCRIKPRDMALIVCGLQSMSQEQESRIANAFGVTPAILRYAALAGVCVHEIPEEKEKELTTP